MMGWFRSSLSSPRRSSWEFSRAAIRDRLPIVEDLGGRRLLSHAIESLASLPSVSMLPSNIIAGPDGNLWLGVIPTPAPTTNTAAIDRGGP